MRATQAQPAPEGSPAARHASFHKLRDLLNRLWRGPWLPLALVLLSLLPPALVFLDSWLDKSSLSRSLRETWWDLPYLSELDLAPYFLLILPAIPLTLLIAYLLNDPLPGISPLAAPAHPPPHRQPHPLQRRVGSLTLAIAALVLLASFAMAILRAQLPGWEFALAYLLGLAGFILKDVPLSHLVAQWRAYRTRLALMLYVHIALIAVLASVYNRSNSWVIALPIGILSTLALFRQEPRVSAGFWILSAALLLFSIGLDAWWFAIVGDEYAFFRYARGIAAGNSLHEIGRRLFHGQAVYASHPYFSSFIQAVFVKIFGATNFGWRSSNLYLSALAVGLFYAFFKANLRSRPALFAALLLACSHYILSFGKIGYNNLQSLFALALTLVLTQLAVRHKLPAMFALAGASWGLCFYVYPAALFAPPIALLYLALYHPPKTRPALNHWSLALGAMLVLIAPLFLQPDYWVRKLPGTFLNQPDLIDSSTRLSFHLSSNLLYAFLSFLYIVEDSHFVVVSYIDPLSGALALLGMALLLPMIRKYKFAAFLILGFGFMLFSLGATHDRPHPSTTRMFMLLPWFVMFSALGLDWLLEQVRSRFPRSAPVIILAAVAWMMILGLNLAQAFPLSHSRMTGRYQSFQVLFLRDADATLNPSDGSHPTVVIVNTPATFVAESLLELLDLYAIPYLDGQIVELDSAGLLENPEAREMVAEPNSLVIITVWVDNETRASLIRLLLRSNKHPYPVKNSDGYTMYEVWISAPIPAESNLSSVPHE